MKEQIEILVQLQKIETEAAAIRSTMDDISEKTNGLDAKVKEFRQSLEKEAASLEEWRKEYRSQESDVKMNLSKIKEKQERLSGASTNKEYQAFLKEIQELKDKNARFEDEMLGSLERIEKTEKEILAKKEEFLEFEARTEEEKKSVLKEAGQKEKYLAKLDTERVRVSEKADPRLLKRFMMIKKIKGIGIAGVSNSICQGCNMNIPPQLYNDLHHGDRLQYCPHCERIIYWKKPDE